MDEADVVARSASPDTAWREAHALRGQPLHGALEIVDPETDMVEWRILNRRLLVRVQRLHQIHLAFEGTAADESDILIDVLAFASIVAGDRQPERIDPQPAQPRLVEPADRNLLDAQNPEGPLRHVCSLRHRLAPSAVHSPPPDYSPVNTGA